MTFSSDMKVTVRLPTRILFEGQATRLTAVAQDGAFGILPNHTDFVTALVPSVLTLRLVDGSENIFGLDEGILVKKGLNIAISALRGVKGDDLGSLKETVENSFVQMDEDERQARSAMSRLEANMVRRFAQLQRRRS